MDKSFETCIHYLKERDECYYSQNKGLSQRGCKLTRKSCDCYETLVASEVRPENVSQSLEYFRNVDVTKLDVILAYIEELEEK